MEKNIFDRLLTEEPSPCIMLKINNQPITGKSTGFIADRDGRSPAESPLSDRPGMSPSWLVEEIWILQIVERHGFARYSSILVPRSGTECVGLNTPTNRGGTAERKSSLFVLLDEEVLLFNGSFFTVASRDQ